ncbi:MAG: proprotein convertase P-domain-containing protein [Phycisphaerae bacterium]
MCRRNQRILILVLICGLLLIDTVVSVAQIGPDVIVGDLFGDGSQYCQVRRWGKLANSDITAYSCGTISCNVGDQPAAWIQLSTNHPAIGQQLYRLKGGQFEQIGLSWVKHGFFALTEDFCSGPGGCITPPGNSGDYLGVGCSDPYSNTLNGLQTRLGPRSDINAATGAFNWPFTTWGQPGDTIWKRLQIHDADLDPALNAGATYLIEGQYVTADDTAAGNGLNNVSYREVQVTEVNPGNFDLKLIGTTVPLVPALSAWRTSDPFVQEIVLDIPSDGRMILAYKATTLGANLWHYEYALYNMNSDRCGQSLSVDIPAGANVSNVAFHDVDYHGGDGVPFGVTYSAVDWAPVVTANSVSWATDTFATDPNANALRWGTVYNFRFDADVPPQPATVTIGLFKPGTPTSMQAVVNLVASTADCNQNGRDDTADIACGGGNVCNGLAGSFDCDLDGIPDDCQVADVLLPFIDVPVNPPLAIPDGAAQFVSDSVTVPDTGVIVDLDLGVNITHTWNGDLTVRLTHNATTVVVIDRPGFPCVDSNFGFNNDGFSIFLDDEGMGGYVEDIDVPTGVVSPPSLVPNHALSAFDGQDPSGVWTIEVRDDVAQDSGTLDNWSMRIALKGTVAPCPPPCVCPGDLDGNAAIDGSDIGPFVDMYLGSLPVDPCAELAAPDAVPLDAADLTAFVAALLNGTCPP